MSLRIQIENIVSEGFDLELPRDEGASDRVVFRKVVALRGGYQHDAHTIHLRHATATELGLAEVAWHWEGGRVLLPATSDLRDVLLDLLIARGPLGKRRRLLGTVRVGAATFRDLGYESGTTRVSAEVALGGLELVESEGEKAGSIAVTSLRASTLEVSLAALAVTLEKLEMANTRVLHGGGVVDVTASELRATGVATSVGGARVRVGGVAATEVRLHQSARGVEVSAATLQLRDLEIHLANARLLVDQLTFTGGATYRGGALSVGGVTAGSVRVEAERSAPSAEPPPPSKRSRRRKIDLHVLDHLEGRLDVDVHVDARVPFLKRRQATHRFRIPILHGCLDYKRLEKDLSLLEDSLLDFEVRKGRLVLEVKPPILRFAKKTLVEWPLEPDELALAEKHRVHLRTLAGARPVKGKDAEDGEKSSFELSRLDFDPIDAELRLGGPTEIDLGDRGLLRLGGDGAPAIELLRVKGAVHHRATGQAPPTELSLGLRSVSLGLEGLHAGSAKVDADGVFLGAADDVRIVAQGMRPISLAATLTGLTVRRLQVQLGASRRSK